MSAHTASLRLRSETRFRSRAARGDAAAFAAVYERHHQALYRYCRSLLHHDQDAQDALQNALIRAFAALQKEERDFDLSPWLFRIAHNEAITLLRQRRGTTTLDEAEPALGAVEDRVVEREEMRVLRADLADLPDRQRAALVLRELNGLSHAEIGQVLDLSAAGVKQALFDARTSLSHARDGRALACVEVRRKLSDGDGRVLRGRGVRAHLRSCAQCRGFRAELAARPQRLRLLAPPLPVAGAASLLSQLLGGAAVKLLACVVIAGGGTTLAVVELESSRAPAREAATVERASARIATPSPATSPAGRAFVAPAAGLTDRATPAATNEPSTRRGGRRFASTPTPTSTRAPAASRHATAANPATATAPPQTATEAPATEVQERAPAVDRRDDEAAVPRNGKSRTKAPPGQDKKPVKPGKTNPGKAHGRAPAAQQPATTPAGTPGNGNGNAGGNGNGNANGNATPGAPAQPESPGNSGNAPGHSEAAGGPANASPNAGANGNGNSANAPGHTKPDKPDKSS